MKLLDSRSRVPLSTFSCRFYQLRWWSPAEVHWTVHVDCPRGQIQTFWVIRAKRPLQASLLSLTVLGVPQDTKGELGAAFWQENLLRKVYIIVFAIRESEHVHVAVRVLCALPCSFSGVFRLRSERE